MSLDNEPLVSVLMTVYNREQYIAEAIESVLASTYQNWELIIVDDQSKDRSVEIAKSYEANDERIKVYINEKNLGDYPNRNRAAYYARGKYLKYLDSDDIIYEYSLNIFVKAMEDNSTVAAAICYYRIDDLKRYPQLIEPEDAYRQYFFESTIFGTGPSMAIIRRDKFEELNGFLPIKHEGDIEFWLRISALNPVLKIQPALVWWRIHPDQQFRKRKNINLNYHTKLKALLSENCPLEGKDKLLAMRQTKRRGVRNVIHMVFKKGDISLGYSELKRSKFTIIDIIRGLI